MKRKQFLTAVGLLAVSPLAISQLGCSENSTTGVGENQDVTKSKILSKSKSEFNSLVNGISISELQQKYNNENNEYSLIPETAGNETISHKGKITIIKVLDINGELALKTMLIPYCSKDNGRYKVTVLKPDDVILPDRRKIMKKLFNYDKEELYKAFQRGKGRKING